MKTIYSKTITKKSNNNVCQSILKLLEDPDEPTYKLTINYFKSIRDEEPIDSSVDYYTNREFAVEQAVNKLAKWTTEEITNLPQNH